LNGFYLDRDMTPPPWLTEHLAARFPGKEWMPTLLEATHFPFTIVRNENARLHYGISVLEAIPVSRFFLGAIYNRVFLPITRSGLLSRLAGPILEIIDRGECYRQMAIIDTGGSEE
jgi:hypothetical protein